MLNHKHLEAERKLRAIDTAAENGNLVDKSGEQIGKDHPKLKKLHASDLYDFQITMKEFYD